MNKKIIISIIVIILLITAVAVFAGWKTRKGVSTNKEPSGTVSQNLNEVNTKKIADDAGKIAIQNIESGLKLVSNNEDFGEDNLSDKNLGL